MTEPPRELYAEEAMTLESDSLALAGEHRDAHSSLPARLEAERLKLSDLQRAAALVNKAMASKRAELESLKGEVRAARKKKAHSTLTLLRERDAALERVQILERQLTLYYIRKKPPCPVRGPESTPTFSSDWRCGVV